MADLRDLHPPKWVNSELFEMMNATQLDLTIRLFCFETVNNPQTQKAEKKGVIYFDEINQGLILNVVNNKSLIALHGHDTTFLPGKKISLYREQLTVAGKTRWGVRVKPEAPLESNIRQADDTGTYVPDIPL